MLKAFKFCLLILFQMVQQLNAFEYETFVKPQVKEVNMELIKAIHVTIEEILIKRYSTVNLVTAAKDPKEPYFEEFRNLLLLENKGSCIFRFDNHISIKTIKYRLKNSIIILLDNLKSFEIFNKQLQVDKFNFRGLYLFIFVYGNFPESNLIFEALWKKNIMNVNALYEEVDEYGENSVKLVTFFPFTKEACGNINPIVIDTFSNSTFNIPIADIFPKKFINLHKCEIRMVTFHRCPGSCLSNRTGKITATGYDIEIIETIAERMNFKLSKNILWGPEQWGNVFPNLTSNGALGKLIRNESDIAIGDYILRPSRDSVLDNSVVYFTVPLVFVIPMGEKMTAFEKLIRPFEPFVWTVLLMILSLGFLAIFILNWKFRNLRSFVYGTGVRNPTLNIARAMFGQSMTKLPRRNFARYILMVILLFCFVQRNVYQALLYIFLRTDGRHKEVQTLLGLIEKGYDFHMFESYVEMIDHFPTIYSRRKIVKSERNLMFHEPLNETVKSAYLTTLSNVIYRNKQTHRNFTMKICKQTLLMVNIVMYFPKNFYLVPQIDKTLTDLAAAGFLEYWIQKYVDLKYLRPKERQSRPKPMELNKLHGVFNICLIGLGISIIVFVIELFLPTIKRKLWKYLYHLHIKMKRLFDQRDYS